MDELDDNAPWQYYDDFRLIVGNANYDQCVELFHEPSDWSYTSWHNFIGSLDFSDINIMKQLPKDYKKYLLNYIEYNRSVINKNPHLTYLIKYIYLLGLDECPSYITNDFINTFCGWNSYDYKGYANLKSIQENVYLPHFYTMNTNDKTKICDIIYEKNYVDDFIYTLGISDKDYYDCLSPEYQIGVLI